MPVRLDVWSDYVCPFCYLEEPAEEKWKLKEEVERWLRVEGRIGVTPASVLTLPQTAPSICLSTNSGGAAIYVNQVSPSVSARRMHLFPRIA